MKVPQNLRIAFFGSDAFSLASLKKLHALQRTSNVIAELDVVTRDIKRSGRYLTDLKDYPVGIYAQENSLPLFRADSRRAIVDQLMPNGYDMAVAVSYGALIPGKFLKSLTYEGLNVHPSFLPQYSGSSPIQYALMDDCATTGVTVQTLHHTKFDHGDIIARSQPVEISYDDNFSSLQDKLALVGADLLASVIQDGDYVEHFSCPSPEKYSLAPKITSQMAQIDWDNYTSRQIVRRLQALGPLYTCKFASVIKKKKLKEQLNRVILDDISEASTDGLTTPGEFKLHDNRVLVKTIDGAVSVGKLKYEYCLEEDPTTFMRNLSKRAGQTLCIFQSCK